MWDIIERKLDRQTIDRLPNGDKDNAGIYRICTRKAVPYPRGQSRVIYIGKSSNIKNALLNHVRGKTDGLERYRASHGSLTFQIYHLPENESDAHRTELQHELELKHETRFGAMPLARRETAASKAASARA